MTRYYDTRIEKIITTKEIPQWLLNKKPFYLPVEINKVNILDTKKTKEVDGIVVLKDKVIWTTVTKTHIDTLEEAKIKKVSDLKIYVAPMFPKDYKQRSALMSVYTDKENERITNEVHKWYEYIEGFEEAIIICEDIEELESINYTTEEDKLNSKNRTIMDEQPQPDGLTEADKYALENL